MPQNGRSWELAISWALVGPLHLEILNPESRRRECVGHPSTAPIEGLLGLFALSATKNAEQKDFKIGGARERRTLRSSAFGVF